MNDITDREFELARRDYEAQFAQQRSDELWYTGDVSGNLNVTGAPDMMWVNDGNRTQMRVKRNAISGLTPAGTPIFIGDVEGYNNNGVPEMKRVATEAIDNYAGQTFLTAYVGAAMAIAYAGTDGNITSDGAFFYYDASQRGIVSKSNTGGPSLNFDGYSDTLTNNPFFLGRAAGGTKDAPTQALTGKNLMRFSAAGYGATGFSGSTGRLDFTATEDHTDANHGTEINLWSTPKLSATAVKRATLQDDGLFRMAFGGAINRNQASGDITIPDGYSMVVSGYYTLAAGAALTLAGDAELRIV